MAKITSSALFQQLYGHFLQYGCMFTIPMIVYSLLQQLCMYVVIPVILYSLFQWVLVSLFNQPVLPVSEPL